MGAALSVLTAVAFMSDFEGSELSGGVVTAVILRLYDLSVGLLVVTVVACLCRRASIGAVMAVVAALLAAPLYTYVLLPGIFRFIVPGEYSVAVVPMAHWDSGTATALVALVVTTSMALAALLRLAQERARATE